MMKTAKLEQDGEHGFLAQGRVDGNARDKSQDQGRHESTCFTHNPRKVRTYIGYIGRYSLALAP